MAAMVDAERHGCKGGEWRFEEKNAAALCDPLTTTAEVVADASELAIAKPSRGEKP